MEIGLALDDPARNGELDPFPLEVVGGTFEVFSLDDAEAVPRGLTHGLEVRSVNDVPIVAERSAVGHRRRRRLPGRAHQHRVPGRGRPVGVRRRAARARQLERIALLNPGDEEVEVRLLAFGDGERTPLLADDEPVVLAPGEHVEVDVGELQADAPERSSLEVDATGPVVAERRILAPGGRRPPARTQGAPGRGASVALGVAVGPGIVVLGD